MNPSTSSNSPSRVDSHAVPTLRLDDIPQTMALIAQEIRNRRFSPDHVLYIESAGRLLGRELARQLGCSASGIFAARSGGRFKSLIAPVFRHLPVWISHTLRRLEIGSGFHKADSRRRVLLSQAIPPHAHRIVVVDDAVDSGHSMQAVLDFLREQGIARGNILTAAINVTSKYPVCAPDISLYDHLITFPWSPGSEDWNAYRALVQRPEPAS